MTTAITPIVVTDNGNLRLAGIRRTAIVKVATSNGTTERYYTDSIMLDVNDPKYLFSNLPNISTNSRAVLENILQELNPAPVNINKAPNFESVINHV
jgi:hypothetical protein